MKDRVPDDLDFAGNACERVFGAQRAHQGTSLMRRVRGYSRVLVPGTWSLTLPTAPEATREPG